MGSPLGVTFANFYMTHLENTVFQENPELKPLVYCRYVDDCFLIVENVYELNRIISAFKDKSVLNFTHEIGGNKLNFLDVSIEKSGTENFKTDVFKKPTDPGVYLNSISECPDRYKEGTIKNLINRTYKISSSPAIFQKSIKNLK